ncbi:CHAD domain-containing protein [Edaphobacter flagellatus]|uniref:CHAD domain-containing protein n=1 Tax=Edaphobacter flagellatus TaxID=1933044 RepID=UPI0021B1920E|nr:CHAD domain-containing protein [Edaphobacter flagellatus]
MASTTLARPIRALREYATALEAAIIVCLGDSKPRHVHRLRTMIRRIEGQLALLDLIPNAPKNGRLSSEIKRLIKKLRRAAGEVRDRDVQLALVAQTLSSRPSRALQQDAATLHTIIETERTDAAYKLRKLLRRDGAATAEALEALVEMLDSASSLSLGSEQLITLVDSWFEKNAPEGSLENVEHLHTVRKMAKLARYMAENAPRAARMARKQAASFEALQESGGRWHDWLILAEIAHNRLRKNSPLAKSFDDRCRVALAAYRRRLSTAVAA